MKQFIHELLHADSVAEVLSANRKEAVKLVLLLVLILLIILLYLHQSSAELQISDDGALDAGGQATEQKDASEGADGAEGSGEYAAADYGDSGEDAAAGGALLPGSTEGSIFIDIDGAVKEPKLAELPAGSRVEDAIEAAGGLKKDADLSGINRAQILSDGEKVYIPVRGEAYGSAGGVSGGSAGTGGSGEGASAGTGGAGNVGNAGDSGGSGVSGGRININTADSATLQQITGVGPVTAQKIIDYRQAHGQFSTIEDIKNISGIGEKTFEKMRDEITV